MHFSLSVLSTALSACVAVVAAQELDFSLIGRGNVGPVDYTELKARLSSSAEVYFPGSIDFAQSTGRWSNASTPVANIVAVPATEQDVVNIVSFYSNSYETAVY